MEKKSVLHAGIESAQENVREEPGPEVLPRDHSREESPGRDVALRAGGKMLEGWVLAPCQQSSPTISPVSQGSHKAHASYML